MPPSCLHCKHYYVTWDPQAPRGCKAYNFKSSQVPSVVIKTESKKDCYLFDPKEKKKLRPGEIDLNDPSLW